MIICTYNLRLSWIKHIKYVSCVGDSLGMGIGADNSTSRRGSRVAGKKDYTNFDFDAMVLFCHQVFTFITYDHPPPKLPL